MAKKYCNLYCKNGHYRTHKNSIGDGKCKLCHKLWESAWKDKNREHVRVRAKQWRQKHPENLRAMGKRSRDKITDNYIINHLLNKHSNIRIKKADVTPEFIELYRINLQLRREKRKWTSKLLTTSE